MTTKIVITHEDGAEKLEIGKWDLIENKWIFTVEAIIEPGEKYEDYTFPPNSFVVREHEEEK